MNNVALSNAFYTNFPGIYKISLENASLLYYKGVITAEYMREYYGNRNVNGIKDDMEQELTVSFDKKLAVYREKTGNKISMSRICIKEGYPVWDVVSGQLTGLRFMDANKPGMFYIVIPSLFREPLPVSIKVLKKQHITVKAGTFQAVKIGMDIKDPFLGNLFRMMNAANDVNIWMEDSPRGVLLKSESGPVNFELENIGKWE
jgi:hypothetical protein